MKGIRVALLILVALFALGCGGGSGSSGAPDPKIQFFNVSSDAGLIDFLIDDDVVATNLGFAGSNGNFIDTTAELRDVAANVAGTSDTFDAILGTFEKDKDYLGFLFGIDNYGSEVLKKPQVRVVEINRTFLNGNQARLVIFHTFNRATGFDTPAIDFQNPGNNPVVKTTDIAYGDPRTITVTSGAQTFEVRRTGTENVYVSKVTNLTPGKTYAVFVVGQENGTGNFTPDILFLELVSRP